MGNTVMILLKLWPFWLVGGIAVLFIWLANRPSRHRDGDSQSAVHDDGWNGGYRRHNSTADDAGGGADGGGGGD
jgi:hypothetical protein